MNRQAEIIIFWFRLRAQVSKKDAYEQKSRCTCVVPKSTNPHDFACKRNILYFQLLLVMKINFDRSVLVHSGVISEHVLR